MFSLLLLSLVLLSSFAPQHSQAIIVIPKGYTRTENKSPPVITTQPDSSTVFGLEDIFLACEATGNPPPTFRWTKDGEEFDPEDDSGLTVTKGSGTFQANSESVSGSMNKYQGKYVCYASNDLGTAVSRQVQLVTEHPPALQKEKKVKLTRVEGESAILKCNPPTSSLEPVIHWMDHRLHHFKLNDRVMLGKDGNLYFAHVTKEDSRNDYTCNVQYLSARTILPKEAITLTVSSSNQLVRSRRPQMMRPSEDHSSYLALRGQSLELECIVQGYPTPSVQWVRPAGQLSETRVTRAESDRRLRFSNISEEDSGEYQCLAQNTQGKVKHTYTVTVEAAPYWTKEPESQVYAPGESIRLDCQADGVPTPTISWSINGFPFNSIPRDPRYRVQEGVLLLNDVQYTDTAIFQCQASNKHGTILSNTNVYVIELPPQILTANGEMYTVVEGGRAELECETFGSPRPKVTWESENADTLLADPRVNLLTNGTLQIANVSSLDSSVYVCSVVGDGDNSSLAINAELDVLNRTVIVSPPLNLRVKPGRRATFTCLALVDPKLTPPLIQWRRSGQKIFQSYSEDKYTFEGPDLIIANVGPEDEGVYTCEVITKLDMAEASGSITLVDRPDPPTQLQLSDAKGRQVTLSWTPGDDHNSPVLQYRIEFTEDQREPRGGWEVLTRVVVDSNHGNPNNAVLTLRPYMKYHFRVIAINEEGESDPSASSSLHSLPPEAPDDNPEDVRSESNEPESLRITWEEMDRWSWNGPDFQYRVFWRRAVGSGPAWHSNLTQNPPFLVTSGVGNFSAFEIKVQAVNQVGEGPEPDPVIGYSGEDLPLEAPLDLGVEVINSTSVRLVWAPINRDTVRGHLLGYRIRLTRLGNRKHHRGRRHHEPEETLVVDTAATETKRLIGGLRPFSRYNVAVTVFNSKGEGPSSENNPFMTEEGAPGPPMSLHLDSPSETVMNLRWTPPSQPNGILTGYLLQYQQIVDSDDVPMQVESIENHTVTHITLRSLDPHSRYRFYLRGRTSAGDGAPIVREGATTLDGAPPDHFTVSAGEKTVNLSWVSKERHRSVPFHIQYLNKNAVGRSKVEKVEKVDSSLLFYQLQGLSPGSQYRLRFTYNNATFWETDVMTEGAVVSSVQAGGFATEGWFIGLVSGIVLLLLLLLIICFIKRSKGGKYSVKDKEEGQVDSEARPMKDETFGEYSDNEEKRTASQPSLCEDSKLCTSEDNLDDYNGGSATLDMSLVSQDSHDATLPPLTLNNPPPVPALGLGAPPTTNGVSNSVAILDDIMTSLNDPPYQPPPTMSTFK